MMVNNSNSIYCALSQAAEMSSHYALSSQTHAMQKDGQQAIAISILASYRFKTLAYELKAIAPSFGNYRIKSAMFTIGALASIGRPIAKHLLVLCEKFKDSSEAPYIKATCHFFLKLGDVSAEALQHADILINGACCVSYVAMIALGFQIQGAVGLAGLLLIALKRQGCLPLALDKNLFLLTALGSIYSAMNTLSPGIEKILVMTLLIEQGLSLLMQRPEIRRYLPECLTTPLPGKFEKTPIPPTLSEKQLLVYSRKDIFFELNPTYIYAEEIGNLLPKDYLENLDKTSAQDLFQQLKDKIAAKGIVLDVKQKKGLADLETCAVTGKVGELLPSDLETYKKLIKALVKSIMDDEPNFALKAVEFANIGTSCIEGWTREVISMLYPKTNNIRWAVQFELAKMRGEMIKGILNQELNSVLAEMSGGSNDVHTTNAFQSVLWHRYRTYEAELNRVMNPHSFLGSLISMFLLPNKSNAPTNTAESFYTGYNLSRSHAGLLLAGGKINDIRDKMNEYHTSERLVDAIYEAIKPVYPTADDGVAERKRKISWESVLDWMKEFNQVDIIDLDNNLLETDLHGGTYLSRDAVRLLLWDMGILQLG